MKNDIKNGYGLYSREYILNIEEPTVKDINTPVIPDIKEIRAIIHDGEPYLNAKDVILMMKKCSFKFQSISVLIFVKRFVLDLIR